MRRLTHRQQRALKDKRTARRTDLVNALTAFIPDVSEDVYTVEMFTLAVACVNLRQLLLPPPRRKVS